MRAKILNANIRGCERKTGKNGSDYLLVRFEDETGKAEELVDNDLDRQPYYKRNTDMNLTINIQSGRSKTGDYVNIRIIDAESIQSVQEG